MDGRITFFAVVTLVPVGLLVASVLMGGVWIWVALVYLTVFTFAVDELARVPRGPGQAPREFPAADALSALLAVMHFGLLGLAVWAVSGHARLSGIERLAGFYGFGLFFGQVSNSNAHELIHRSRKGLFLLGKWVFISHLFGHHVSAHRLVHHRYVGTDWDPNSAPLGMGFYRFLWTAWWGSFRAGWLAENRIRQVSERPGLHPYTIYVTGAVLMLGMAWLIGGIGGVLAYLGLAGYGAMQVLLSDYVQHYGLVRREAPTGGFEPVGVQHSWNAPQVFSGLMMLNAPRHSDHHRHPGRVFPALGLPEGCPMLPRSLPVMGLIAFWPGRWRALMDPRVRAQQGM